MQQSGFDIDAFDPSEADALGIICYDSIRDGTVLCYSTDQRYAWAPKAPSGADWLSRLTSQWTVVARISGSPVGFMTLNDDGYIDLAFIAPACQRKGIGKRLYSAIEEIARDKGIGRIHSQASYPIKSFFEQQGWAIIREQEVERSGVTLTNFVMDKHLG